jgi:quinol monooxygenase YgiN
MILIVGHLQTSPENVARLKETAASLIEATRKEAGNIAYVFAEDIGQPGLVHIVERWASEEALAAHNKTAHLAVFMGQLPTLGLTSFRVARYETSGETVLADG